MGKLIAKQYMHNIFTWKRLAGFELRHDGLCETLDLDLSVKMRMSSCHMSKLNKIKYYSDGYL